MEHKTLDQLEALASYHTELPHSVPLSKLERLERWADLLDRQPQRRLKMLPGTEYQPQRLRDVQRCKDSPISVAYEDPVLRAAGLQDDTYGAARDFFGLSNRELHRIVCYCHHGFTAQAQMVGLQVRATMKRHSRTGFLARAWSFFAGY